MSWTRGFVQAVQWRPHTSLLSRQPDLVASLLDDLGFCRIRFWYPVASASGISREICRIYFWKLTTKINRRCDFQK
jgi:hypothetical protein